VRIEHTQADDVDVTGGKGDLPFVVGVRGIEQQHRVAGIEQRAKDIVRQLRAAHADGDVLGSEPGNAEQMLLEPRDLLAAFHVAERCGVRAALVKQLAVRHDVEVGLPERFGRRVVDPSAAERNHLRRIEPHRQDVLALGHLHDLSDGRGLRELTAYQARQGGVDRRFHQAMIPNTSKIDRSTDLLTVLRL
jgi:hypothetical protein